MSGRPSDWSAVDLWRDPTPGDADATVQAGRHYRQVADAIATAARRLREIAASPDMESQAVEAFVGKAEEVADDIERAHERYQGVGEALDEYGRELGRAQDDADDALRRGTAARDDLEAARRRLDQAREQLRRAQQDDAAAPPEAPPLDLGGHYYAVTVAEDQVTVAQGALDRAKGDAADAGEAARRAADRARQRIEDVKDSDGLDDSRWDNVAGFLKGLADFAGMVAAVCGVLALAVGWIPVIGQALAAVLGTIALVAGLVALVCNVVLLAGGKGSVKNVVLDLVGVATFGIGRAVVGSARAAYRGSQALARLNAGRIAATSPAGRLAAGLPGGSSASAIRSMLGGNTAIANLSRVQARTMLTSTRLVPSASTWGRALIDDFADFGSSWSTLRSGGNWAAAFRESGAAAHDIRHAASWGERWARIGGDADVVRHARFVDALHDGVRDGRMFDVARNLTIADGIVTGGAFVLDGYQFVDNDLHDQWFNSPADQLDLPSEGALAR